MLLSGISSFSNLLETQTRLRSSQLELQQAQAELSSGRYADVNLHLGGNVSRNLDWRLTLSQTTKFVETNAQASDAAVALQSTLQSMADSANQVRDTLMAARTAQNGPSLVQSSTGLALQGFSQTANSTYGGQYLLAGQNGQTPPLAAGLQAVATNAFDSAFQSYFGFAKSDPQASAITPGQVTQFLNGMFDNEFQGSNWNAAFSTASNQNVKARIDQSTVIDASANANEQPFRDMVKAMAAAAGASGSAMTSSAFQTVIDYATGKISTAIQGFGEVQSRIGEAQQTIASASAKQKSMQSLLQKQIQETENVDPTEAATRLNSLMTQIQANYAVTGKISQLSLLTYL